MCLPLLSNYVSDIFKNNNLCTWSLISLLQTSRWNRYTLCVLLLITNTMLVARMDLHKQNMFQQIINNKNSTTYNIADDNVFLIVIISNDTIIRALCLAIDVVLEKFIQLRIIVSVIGVIGFSWLHDIFQINQNTSCLIFANFLRILMLRDEWLSTYLSYAYNSHVSIFYASQKLLPIVVVYVLRYYDTTPSITTTTTTTTKTTTMKVTTTVNLFIRSTNSNAITETLLQATTISTDESANTNTINDDDTFPFILLKFLPVILCVIFWTNPLCAIAKGNDLTLFDLRTLRAMRRVRPGRQRTRVIYNRILLICLRLTSIFDNTLLTMNYNEKRVEKAKDTWRDSTLTLAFSSILLSAISLTLYTVIRSQYEAMLIRDETTNDLPPPSYTLTVTGHHEAVDNVEESQLRRNWLRFRHCVALCAIIGLIFGKVLLTVQQYMVKMYSSIISCLLVSSLNGFSLLIQYVIDERLEDVESPNDRIQSSKWNFSAGISEIILLCIWLLIVNATGAWFLTLLTSIPLLVSLFILTLHTEPNYIETTLYSTPSDLNIHYQHESPSPIYIE